MSGQSDGDRSDAARLRLVTRIMAVLIVGFTLLIVVGHLVAPEPIEQDYPPIENVMPAIMALSAFSLALAWRREGLAGFLGLSFFVIHLALFRIVRGEFFPLNVLIIFMPLPLAATMFVACWYKSRAS